MVGTSTVPVTRRRSIRSSTPAGSKWGSTTWQAPTATWGSTNRPEA
jgi:hypothetical protein